MASRIRAEIQVGRPRACVLSGIVDRGTVHSVSRVRDTDEGETVSEFVADDPPGDADKVFDYGSRAVYRLTHDGDRPCACDRVEAMGYPVRDHRVQDGVVVLAFFVPGIADLRDVVEELSSTGRRVSIRRLTRSGDDECAELVVVDRSELTDRQLEVLRTADRMGYFEYPPAANAGEVAAALDISRSTFAEHLAAAQRKLLAAVLA